MLVAFVLLSRGSAVEAQAMPRSALTPGVAASVGAPAVCRSGYAASVRPRGVAWRRLKEQVYRRYGLARGHRSTIDAGGRRRPAYAIDHLIPIELGGAPADVRNLWPEPIAESRRKDRVEDALHARVCNGDLSLAQAQRAIVADWRHALR